MTLILELCQNCCETYLLVLIYISRLYTLEPMALTLEQCQQYTIKVLYWDMGFKKTSKTIFINYLKEYNTWYPWACPWLCPSCRWHSFWLCLQCPWRTPCRRRDRTPVQWAAWCSPGIWGTPHHSHLHSRCHLAYLKIQLGWQA